MKLTLIIGLLFGLTSCSYYVYPPKVYKRTEIEYSYKLNKNFERSKWRKTSQKTSYEQYDKKGNLVEEGEFGEMLHFGSVIRNSDSSISVTTGDGINFKNINTVQYNQFDSTGKKISDELWQFKNNNKNFLIYKTIYYYSTLGQLIKEVEYNENNKVSRAQSYSRNGANMTISIDTVFNISLEGITRFESKRQDTTITDSLGRPIEKIHFYNDKFLYRQEFRNDRWGGVVTEIRYDDNPDSLWCITEWQYNSDNQLFRKFWKVIGRKTETKDIYIYNRKKLLVKKLHYNSSELEGYTKYKYKIF